MAKLILNNIGSLIDTTTAQTTINTNNDSIETALENTLSRDGTSPNSMNAAIDMNSNHIYNLPSPTGPTEPLRLQDASTLNGGGTISSLPAGGSTDNVLAKTSNTDYIVGWKANTGTGSVVLANSPTLVTPTLGAATATSVNKVALTAPASNATLTIADGKTLSVSSNLTLAGPDGSLTFQGTDTYVGRATTDTLTNKTINASQLVANSVGNAQLRQGAALSIIGVTGNATANVADIASPGADRVFRTNAAGTAVSWGPINLASTNAVTGTLALGNGGTGQTTIAGQQGALFMTFTNTASQTVNFNSVADTTFTITIPTGATSYRFIEAYIYEAVSVPINAAIFRVFTSAGGAGTALSASTTGTITTTSSLTTAGAQLMGSSDATIWLPTSQTSLFFRVTTAQGATASAKVKLVLEWNY